MTFEGVQQRRWASNAVARFDDRDASRLRISRPCGSFRCGLREVRELRKVLSSAAFRTFRTFCTSRSAIYNGKPPKCAGDLPPSAPGHQDRPSLLREMRNCSKVARDSADRPTGVISSLPLSSAGRSISRAKVFSNSGSTSSVSSVKAR
jgi:hypothetical protein